MLGPVGLTSRAVQLSGEREEVVDRLVVDRLTNNFLLETTPWSRQGLPADNVSMSSDLLTVLSLIISICRSCPLQPALLLISI